MNDRIRIRIATEQQDLSLALVPYTELVAVSSDGNFEVGLAKSDLRFSLRVRVVGDAKVGERQFEVDGVPPEVLKLAEGRLHYIFADSAALFDAIEKQVENDFLRDLASVALAGRLFTDLKSSPFVLIGLVVQGNGSHRVASASATRTAAQAQSLPATFDAKPTVTVDLSSAAEGFVIGSGMPLNLEAIERIEQNGIPKPFPKLPVNGLYPIVPLGEDSFAFAYPSIDPVVLTRVLTQKYHQACDKYLAHSQDFENPAIPIQENDEAARGYRNFLKNNLAHAFVSLLKSAPTMSSELAEAGKSHQNFIEKYRKNLESLLKAREDAARNLVAWLKSDLMKEAEAWFRTDDVLHEMTVDGTAQVTTSELVNVLALAHARLSESEAGADYALKALKTAKGTGAVQGVERVIADFILPDESKGPSFTKVSLTASVGVFNAWASFATLVAIRTVNGEALDFIRARSKSGQAALNDAIEVLASFPNKAFGKALIELKKLRELELDGSVADFSKRLKTRLDKPLNLGGLADTMNQFSPGKDKAAGEITEKGLRFTLTAVNALVKVCSLVEQVKNQGSGASLNEATLSALEGLVAFSEEIGKLAISKAAVSKTFSSTLGLVAAGLAILAAAEGVRDKFERHDWDAMAAKLTEGVGAAVTAFGIYLMATAPATGPTPAAGFLLVAGGILGVGGAVWGLFAEDVPYEQLLKFSAFGNDPAADVKAPSWSMADSFKEWDPKTEKGLQLQLRAAEQLLHAFVVEGLPPAGASFAVNTGIRITPAFVLPNSTFHILYEAQYKPFAGSVQPPLKGTCKIDIHAAPTPTGLAGTMTDLAKTFDETAAVSVNQVGGTNVVDVAFNKLPPVMEGTSPLEIFNFTVRVRLDVHGDGSAAAQGSDGTLVVPNSKSGARFVISTLVEEGKGTGKRFKTYDVS